MLISFWSAHMVRKSRIAEQVATYDHKGAESPMRPDVGRKLLGQS